MYLKVILILVREVGCAQMAISDLSVTPCRDSKAGSRASNLLRVKDSTFFFGRKGERWAGMTNYV
jgi:hypothetical protein